MTRTIRDLRELFDDMSAGAPDERRRIDELDRRIRRDTRRRGAGLALAGVAALTAVAVLIPTALLPRAPGKPQETMAAPELPRRFTAKDGTEYRRLVTTTLRTKDETKTSVTIPVSGRPLDVAGLCDKAAGLSERPRILVNGEPSTTWFGECTGKPQLVALNVPKGATRATVTFDTSAWDCGRKKHERCPRPTTMNPADWSLAVYEWTPPARPAEPEQIKVYPRALGGYKLDGHASGVWPRRQSYVLTVTSPGGKLGIELLCTGDLAERLQISYRIGDKPTQTSLCQRRKGEHDPGMAALVTSEIRVPKGEKVTIRGGTKMPGGHPGRPVRWSVGVYVMP